MSDENNNEENNQGGDPKQEFLNQLPEGLRAEASLQDFTGVEGLAKSFVEARKMIGNKNNVRLPSGEEGDNDWDTVYKKMGRPDAPDGYNLKTPEDVKIDDKVIVEFKQRFHKSGLSPRQAQEIFSDYTGTLKGRHDASVAEKERISKESLEKAEATLRGHWGNPNYETNMGIADKTIEEFGGPDFKALLVENGLEHHPTIKRVFADIAKKYSDDVLPHGPGKSMMTKDDARTERMEMINNPKSALRDMRHAGHDEALKRMEKLMAIEKS